VAFTKALYYPSIDVRDEQWLINAMLFWECIETIVPESIDSPYESDTARSFADEGMLLPFRVASDSDEVREVEDEVIQLLDSPQASALLFDLGAGCTYLHPEKLPPDVRRLFDALDHFNYPPDIVREMMADHRPEGFLRVGSHFAEYYMSLLARSIADRKGLGLLTDRSSFDAVANMSRLDNYITIDDASCWPERRHRHMSYWRERQGRDRFHTKRLSQGCMADLILQGIDIDPETSVESILRFRRNHADELARFRTEVDRLTIAFSDEQPSEAFQQSMKDIIINDVMPSYNDLKRCLDASSIRWLAGTFLKVTTITTPATSVSLNLLGLSVPHALMAGIGVSFVASLAMFNEERERTLRANPYTYLLSLERSHDRPRAARHH
jgi:hypothetical protein